MTVKVDSAVSNVLLLGRRDLLDRSVRRSAAKLYQRLMAFAVLSFDVEHASTLFSENVQGLKTS